MATSGLQVGGGAGAVDQQRLGGAADAGAAHLGVEHDALRHLEIGRGVHEDVADAFEMREDRHPRLLLHPRDEALAAARHDHVEIAVEPGSMAPTARGRGSARAGSRRPAGRPAPALPHGVGDGLRRAEALRAGAQDRGVAGLQAERARIGRHVGTALEDDADHAERRRDPLDLRGRSGARRWRARARPDRADRRCSRPPPRWPRAAPGRASGGR